MSRYPSQPLEEKLTRLRERMDARLESDRGSAGLARKYATIRDVAAELNISYSKAREIVKDEPGVLDLSRGKRRKLLRIPRDMFERIVRRAGV